MGWLRACSSDPVEKVSAVDEIWIAAEGDRRERLRRRFRLFLEALARPAGREVSERWNALLIVPRFNPTWEPQFGRSPVCNVLWSDNEARALCCVGSIRCEQEGSAAATISLISCRRG